MHGINTGVLNNSTQVHKSPLVPPPMPPHKNPEAFPKLTELRMIFRRNEEELKRNRLQQHAVAVLPKEASRATFSPPLLPDIPERSVHLSDSPEQDDAP